MDEGEESIALWLIVQSAICSVDQVEPTVARYFDSFGYFRPYMLMLS